MSTNNINHTTLRYTTHTVPPSLDSIILYLHDDDTFLHPSHEVCPHPSDETTNTPLCSTDYIVYNCKPLPNIEDIAASTEITETQDDDDGGDLRWRFLSVPKC
jgi:hypothetical protein